MPKRSDAFQTLVAQIQHHLGRNTPLVVEESKMLPNAGTGELREVDIVVEGNINGVNVIIGFECHKQRRTAGSPWVEAMIGKHRKLPTHRLILVSESGFTRPALLAVKSEKDVEAVSFEEAGSIDWGAYAENMTDLRFSGFEATPTALTVKWAEPDRQDDFKIDNTTVFRRLADGIEVNGLQLASAYLKDERFGRLLMDKYFRDGNAKELHQAQDKTRRPFTAQGTTELAVTWTPDAYEWEIVHPSGTLLVQSIVISTTIHIKDSPLELKYTSFMGHRIAQAVLQKPFKNISGENRDGISVAFTQTSIDEPVVSVSYTTHTPDKQKLFFLKD